ncbi:unnamed protein product [Hymenolepis diminuta]|uniref:Uncharacterized protein n=1 Tax=Hymenolepis diminuta TaxID=6216 RepID=A0A564Z8S2_HYMDI|nr:unnamed protein product [Hymenolepis diminuta]
MFPILETLPNDIGGTETVKFAQEHPNRELYIFWISLSILLVVQVFIILIFVINCCCCCGQEDEVADELLLVLKNKLSEQFDALEYNLESVGDHISGYARPISVSFYCIGGFLIAMLIIASLVIARLLYRTFRDKLYVDQANFFVESGINIWDKLACGKVFACCFSAYFTIIISVLAIAIGLLLFLLTVAAGEGCIYFTRETAIQKTDHVFNSIIAEKWMEIYPQWSGYFNTNPPRNALKTLTTTCKYDPHKETIGLLYAMGCDNILNISGIARSKFLQNKLKKGKSLTYPFIIIDSFIIPKKYIFSKDSGIYSRLSSSNETFW